MALVLMSTTRLPSAFAGPALAFGAGYGSISAFTTQSVAEATMIAAGLGEPRMKIEIEVTAHLSSGA